MHMGHRRWLSSSIALILELARMVYRSKCKTIDCCGIKCERDVQGEEALDAQQQSMQHNNDRESPTSTRVLKITSNRIFILNRIYVKPNMYPTQNRWRMTHPYDDDDDDDNNHNKSNHPKHLT